MAEMSDQERKLILQMAVELRDAIAQRNEQTAPAIARYDIAVEGGDDEEVFHAALILFATLALIDPVGRVLDRGAAAMRILRATSA